MGAEAGEQAVVVEAVARAGVVDQRDVASLAEEAQKRRGKGSSA